MKAPLFPTKPAITVKQTIVSDGHPHKYRIDLSAVSGYQGAMKDIKISFSDAGKANITRVYLGK